MVEWNKYYFSYLTIILLNSLRSTTFSKAGWYLLMLSSKKRCWKKYNVLLMNLFVDDSVRLPSYFHFSQLFCDVIEILVPSFLYCLDIFSECGDIDIDFMLPKKSKRVTFLTICSTWYLCIKAMVLRVLISLKVLMDSEALIKSRNYDRTSSKKDLIDVGLSKFLNQVLKKTVIGDYIASTFCLLS